MVSRCFVQSLLPTPPSLKDERPGGSCWSTLIIPEFGLKYLTKLRRIGPIVMMIGRDPLVHSIIIRGIRWKGSTLRGVVIGGGRGGIMCRRGVVLMRSFGCLVHSRIVSVGCMWGWGTQLKRVLGGVRIIFML